jgi:hypothetical protein
MEEETPTVDLHGAEIIASHLEEACERVLDGEDIVVTETIVMEDDGWNDADVYVHTRTERRIADREFNAEDLLGRAKEALQDDEPSGKYLRFVEVEGEYGCEIPKDADFDISTVISNQNPLKVTFNSEDDISELNSWGGNGEYDSGAYITEITEVEYE